MHWSGRQCGLASSMNLYPTRRWAPPLLPFWLPLIRALVRTAFRNLPPVKCHARGFAVSRRLPHAVPRASPAHGSQSGPLRMPILARVRASGAIQ